VFLSFLRCQFLGVRERVGSDGSISGMSDFGSFWRIGLAYMNGCGWWQPPVGASRAFPFREPPLLHGDLVYVPLHIAAGVEIN
jgi:hypothetical protein